MIELPPGEERTSKVSIRGVFRGERFQMFGHMDEVRGHFKIKRSRLPLLNRENVIAYSNVTRVKSKRRTTVEYREHAQGNFVRSYLPENVVYVHTDPLSYIQLKQLFVGKEPILPTDDSGVPAVVFGDGSLDNGVCLPSCSTVFSLHLENHGDITVQVYASVFGVEAVG